MKIVLDARWIFPEISGIGRYTQELIGHLAPRFEHDDLIVLFNRPEVRDRVARELDVPSFPRVAVRTVPWGLFSPGNQLWMPRLLAGLRADVYHSPNYLIPFSAFPRRGTAADPSLRAGGPGLPMVPALSGQRQDRIPLRLPHLRRNGVGAEGRKPSRDSRYPAGVENSSLYCRHGGRHEQPVLG